MTTLHKVVVIGASLMNAGTNDFGLSELTFPGEFTLKSDAPFALSLSEAGVMLRASQEKVAVIQSADSLLRIIHSATQIAFLNKTENLLEIYAGQVTASDDELGDASDSDATDDKAVDAAQDEPESEEQAPEETAPKESGESEEQAPDVDAPVEDQAKAEEVAETSAPKAKASKSKGGK